MCKKDLLMFLDCFSPRSPVPAPIILKSIKSAVMSGRTLGERAAEAVTLPSLSSMRANDKIVSLSPPPAQQSERRREQSNLLGWEQMRSSSSSSAAFSWGHGLRRSCCSRNRGCNSRGKRDPLHYWVVWCCFAFAFNIGNYAISRQLPCHNQGSNADKTGFK